MMNIVQIQDRLKDYSNDQLMSSMQNPSGDAPQYLILSELSRRKRMQDDFDKNMSRGQTTVAEDLVSANGVPKQGLAALSSMAPRTDVARNDGVASIEQSYTPRGTPPTPVAEGYADGGLVVRNGMMVPRGPFDSSAIEEYLSGIQEEPRAILPAASDVRPPTAPEFDARSGDYSALALPPYQPRLVEGLLAAPAGPAPDVDRQNLIDERLRQMEGFRGPMIGVPDRYRDPDVTTVMDFPPYVNAPNDSSLPGFRVSNDPAAPEIVWPPTQAAQEGPAAAQQAALTEVAKQESAQQAAAQQVAAQQAGSSGPAGQGGGSGGSVKSGGQIGAMLEELAKERKINAWLALAKAGAALASSRAPSLGSALGEAAGVGLDALTEGRSDNNEKKRQLQLAQMQFNASRSSGTPRAPDPFGGLSLKDRLKLVGDMGINEIQMMLALNSADPKDPGTVLTPEQKLALVEVLNDRRRKAAILSGGLFGYDATQPVAATP